MADRIPLRIVTVSGVPTIGEFQRGDTVGVVHGGTGVSSIAGLKAALDYNLSGLDDVAVGFPDALAANQILVWNGTAWINEYNDKTEMRVRNGTASAMSKGDVIAIQDAHNQNLVNVILADASQTSAMPALGVLEQDLAAGEEGIAITFGKVQGVVTTGFTEGATAYVSPTTPGGIVDSRPTADNHLVQNIGIVMRAHASNGAIKVTGIGRANDIPNDVSSNIASNTSAIENSAQLSDVSVELSSLVSSIHHGDLSGLGDNDHPQYVLSSTNSALSSVVDALGAFSYMQMTSDGTAGTTELNIGRGATQTVKEDGSNNIVWDSANNEFDVSATGTYHVLANLVLSVAATATIDLKIKKNSTAQNTFAAHGVHSAEDPEEVTMQCVFDATAGDTISVTYDETASNNVTPKSGTNIMVRRLA